MAQNILFVGSIVVDVIAPVDRLPQSGQGVVAEGVTMNLGGCACNSANIARQLVSVPGSAAGEGEACEGEALPRVQLFAPVGEGPFAAFVRDELAARNMSGYEVTGTGVDNCAAICLIEPDGERTMLTLPGIERRFADEWFADLESSCDLQTFGSGSLCGYEAGSAGGIAMIGFFERHPHLQLWFAPGPMICSLPAEKIARINALKPIWHLNEAEVLSYTRAATLEEGGRALAEQCGNAVVATAGGEGCYVFFSEGEVLHVPTEPIRPVDTIGAGDSHLGALMAARAAGRSWEEACALANKVAGTVCGVTGAILSEETFAASGLHL